MPRARWIVETREPAVDDPLDHRPATAWTRDTLGEEDARTTYSSRAAAERQIKALRRLGGEWAEREYRARLVRPSEGRPEAERDAVVVSMRLRRPALAALDALATARGLSRGATVAALVMEAEP